MYVNEQIVRMNICSEWGQQWWINTTIITQATQHKHHLLLSGDSAGKHSWGVVIMGKISDFRSTLLIHLVPNNVAEQLIIVKRAF